MAHTKDGKRKELTRANEIEIGEKGHKENEHGYHLWSHFHTDNLSALFSVTP